MRSIGVPTVAPIEAGRTGRGLSALLPFVPLASLAIVVGLSALAHLWGIRGDLPYPPDVDEPIFMRAAIHIASGHLSPDWFGHPGSTVIYPLAAAIRAGLALQDPGTLLHLSVPDLGARVAEDPAPFYLLGRLISAAYGVGCVALTWAIARRVAGLLAAWVAALVLPASWIVVSYGQLLRTDTAGTFFALLFLLFLLRAVEADRTRDWALAAVAIGLGASSRYFLVMLGVPYLLAAVTVRGTGTGADRRRKVRRLALATLAPLAFAATSPSIPLHVTKVISDLRLEARAVAPGADGLSPIGNAIWYVTHVVPDTLGPIVLVIALVGAAVVAVRRPIAALILGSTAVAYVVGISLSPLHWDRYVIPLVPLAGIAAGVAVDAAVTGWTARRRPSASAAIVRQRVAVTVGAAALAVAALAPGASTVLAGDRLRAEPSTRFVATDWVNAHLPAGSLVCEEMHTTYDVGPLRRYRVFSLADESIAEYRARGCAYLISSTSMSVRYVDASRYPKEAAFYAALPSVGPLVASFAPGPDRDGPRIDVYGLR